METNYNKKEQEVSLVKFEKTNSNYIKVKRENKEKFISIESINLMVIQNSNDKWNVIVGCDGVFSNSTQKAQFVLFNNYEEASEFCKIVISKSHKNDFGRGFNGDREEVYIRREEVSMIEIIQNQNHYTLLVGIRGVILQSYNFDYKEELDEFIISACIY